MAEAHIDVVALLFGAICAIAAFVHLKFESNQNKKEIAQLWKKHDDLSGELRKEISDMNKSLARIEGKLSIENKT